MTASGTSLVHGYSLERHAFDMHAWQRIGRADHIISNNWSPQQESTLKHKTDLSQFDTEKDAKGTTLLLNLTEFNSYSEAQHMDFSFLLFMLVLSYYGRVVVH